MIHVIEIPKFNKTLAELETALDFWLYFLKNGEELDADVLPAELDRQSGVRKAMGVLKMFAQNEMERELYEGRLKAKRDLQMVEAERQTLETQRQTLETQRQTLETQRRTLEAERRTLDVQLGDWQQRYDVANRERETATVNARRPKDGIPADPALRTSSGTTAIGRRAIDYLQPRRIAQHRRSLERESTG